jgi:hypothetical protein
VNDAPLQGADLGIQLILLVSKLAPFRIQLSNSFVQQFLLLAAAPTSFLNLPAAGTSRRSKRTVAANLLAKLLQQTRMHHSSLQPQHWAMGR